MAHSNRTRTVETANKDHQRGVKAIPATQKPFSHKGAAAVNEQKARKGRQAQPATYKDAGSVSSGY
jgi:hypothetical protein